MSQEVLKRLKVLQKAREDAHEFVSYEEIVKWIDQVKPLLAFDEKYFNMFNYHIDHFTTKRNLRLDYIPTLSEAIGVLNQAVTALEVAPEVQKSTKMAPLRAPEKLTLAWLFRHMPLAGWVKIGTILLATFLFGVWFSEKGFYGYLVNG